MTEKEINRVHCEYIERCPFFNDTLGAFPKTVEQLKKAFCLKNHHLCARFQVAQANANVPADLFPTEYARAAEIIAKRTDK